MIGGEDFVKMLSKPMKIAFFVIIGLLCLLFCFLGYKFGSNKKPEVEIRTDTVRIEKTHYKTIHYPDTIKKIVYKPYKVPVYDTIYPEDSIDLDLPYIEGVASVPDTLDIYYHGWIDAGIDSVRIGIFHTTEIVNHTIEIPKYITPRIMINTGIGYAHYDNSYLFAVGEVKYNTDRMTYGVFGGYGTNMQMQGSPFFGVTISARLEIQ